MALDIFYLSCYLLVFFFHGSKIKLVNDLLEGIHLVASVEAISLGVKAGIHPWIIYDIISNAAGNSWCVPFFFFLVLLFNNFVSVLDSKSSVRYSIFMKLVFVLMNNVYAWVFNALAILGRA